MSKKGTPEQLLTRHEHGSPSSSVVNVEALTRGRQTKNQLLSCS